MSKMVGYDIALPKDVVTIDQLLEVMEAMGLKPKLHGQTQTVDSYTVQDSASGNLTFDTSVLGGISRQREGVANVQFDPKTRVVVGGLTLHIDSWSVQGTTEKMAKHMGEHLASLIEAINSAAEASKQTKLVLPGITVREAKEIALALGGQMATHELISEGEAGIGLPNLAESYLNRRVAVHARKAQGTSAAGATDMLRVGGKAKVFSVEIKGRAGRKSLKIGYVPPVASFRQVGNGVEVTLPEIFLPECRTQLDNIRNLGLALRATETQARQHVGAGKPVTHVRVDKAGVLRDFHIDWEKPAQKTASPSLQEQRVAEREAATAAPLVFAKTPKASQLEIAPTEELATISVAALQEGVIRQAREAGIKQFVYAGG